MFLTQETRREAYESIQPKLAGQEQIVIETRYQHGPLTAWDIQEITGMLITSIRRALNNLEFKGKIIPCGTAMGKAGVKVTKYALKAIESPVYWDDRGQGAFFAPSDIGNI